MNESEQEYFIKAGSAGLVKLFSASCVMKALHTHFHYMHGNSQEYYEKDTGAVNME